MDDKFSYAYAFTAKAEGGFSDDKNDRGGATGFGVSLAFLKSLAANSRDNAKLKELGVLLPVTRESIEALTSSQARDILKYEFWDKPKFEVFPKRIACCLFDMAVNHGTSRSIKLAQKGYNATIGNFGAKLAVDGVMGAQTTTALMQESDVLLSNIIEARWAFYEAIMKNDPSQETFRRGWRNRCTNLSKYLGLQ